MGRVAIGRNYVLRVCGIRTQTLPCNIAPTTSFEIRRGDVLLSRKNTYELVGACAYVAETRGRMLLPDLIFRLNIRNPGFLHPIYLWGILTTAAKRKELRQLARGSADSMPNISKERLRSLHIVLAPYEFQCRLAKQVEQIGSIQAQTCCALATSEAAFQSLLHRAFVGEL